MARLHNKLNCHCNNWNCIVICDIIQALDYAIYWDWDSVLWAAELLYLEVEIYEDEKEDARK